jgi:CRISPR-associated endoribonuclease Cas6
MIEATQAGSYVGFGLQERIQEKRALTPEAFSSLELARYELRLRALESASLPAFLGSTLRGAFGHSLKQTVCVMPHRNCDRCMVADRCIYPYLFETPTPRDIPRLRGQGQAPRPFILSPPVPGTLPGRTAAAATSGCAAESQVVSSLDQRLNLRAGDELAFGLVLMGRAIEYLPYLVYSVAEMSRRGLGAELARFELTEVLLNNASGDRPPTYPSAGEKRQVCSTAGERRQIYTSAGERRQVCSSAGERRQVYSGATHRIATPARSAISLSSLIEARLDHLRGAAGFRGDLIKVRFVTPTRIRVEGDLQAGMSFELFVRNLLRRLSLLCAVHGGGPLELDYRGLIERAASVKTVSSRLSWCDWERYSNRQRTKMKLGGFVGEIEYGGVILDEFLSLMVMGELLHVGSGTSFGLGRYALVLRRQAAICEGRTREAAT